MVSIVYIFRHFSPRPARRNWNNEIKRCRKGEAHDSELNAPDRVREITARQLARLKESPLFVDIREEDEYLCGHIPGARNLSRAVLEQAVSEILPDRTKPIILYCARGDSSALAVELMQKAGYENVFSLKGGLFGWLEAGGILQACRKGRDPERSGR